MRLKLTISASIALGASLLLFGCASEQDKVAGGSGPNVDTAASAPASPEMEKNRIQSAHKMSEITSTTGGSAGGATGGKVAGDATVNTRDYDEKTPKQKANGANNKPTSPYKQNKLAAIQDSEPDRYLIKNATVTVESRDVKASTTKIIDAAKKIKGYVSDMHESVEATGDIVTIFDAEDAPHPEAGKESV